MFPSSSTSELNGRVDEAGFPGQARLPHPIARKETGLLERDAEILCRHLERIGVLEGKVGKLFHLLIEELLRHLELIVRKQLVSHFLEARNSRRLCDRSLQ